MPEMSGIETLEHIKNNNRFRNIPVIMVTALTDSVNIEKALSMGAIEYIKKPVDDIELLARMNTVLKLKCQEEKLKESIRIKDDFIRMMSNELVGTFSSIAGSASELIEDVKLFSRMSDDQKQNLTQINDSSELVSEYFNKMLAWSNLGQRQLILDREPVSLRELLKDIETLLMPKIKNKKICFTAEVVDIKVNIDRLYFHNALCNLISNAIRFTPSGGDVSVYTSVSDDVRVLNIEDSGEGVKYDKQYLLTSQYIKSSPDSEGRTGNGTGLYVSRTIMEAHGFWIDFKPAETKGTNFMVFLKNYNV